MYNDNDNSFIVPVLFQVFILQEQIIKKEDKEIYKKIDS